MRDLFAAEEPSGLNKRELYKQNKEAQMMERLERRMEGTHWHPLHLSPAVHSYARPTVKLVDVDVSTYHGHNSTNSLAIHFFLFMGFFQPELH